MCIIFVIPGVIWFISIPIIKTPQIGSCTRHSHKVTCPFPTPKQPACSIVFQCFRSGDPAPFTFDSDIRSSDPSNSLCFDFDKIIFNLTCDGCQITSQAIIHHSIRLGIGFCTLPRNKRGINKTVKMTGCRKIIHIIQ